jgi:hypothetical protein
MAMGRFPYVSAVVVAVAVVVVNTIHLEKNLVTTSENNV